MRRQLPDPRSGGRPDRPVPRLSRRGWLVGCAGILAVVLLFGLGTWQVERLGWKLALIARVDARVHAPPIAPPGPASWAAVTPGADDYLHVRTHGAFETDRDTYVQAVTDDGAGFWLLTPLRTADGFTVLIDRGFVPTERRGAVPTPTGDVTVTGLLRTTEPGGAFLRHNDLADDRWYSRDVGAIASKRGLDGPVAPYFIDADGTPNPGGVPIGGLTVVSFPNNHLVYAVTWYAMGLGLAAALIWAARDGRRSRGRAVQGASDR